MQVEVSETVQSVLATGGIIVVGETGSYAFYRRRYFCVKIPIETSFYVGSFTYIIIH